MMDSRSLEEIVVERPSAVEPSPPVASSRSAAVLLLASLSVLVLIGLVWLPQAVPKIYHTTTKLRLTGKFDGSSWLQQGLEAITTLWFFMFGASLGSFFHCLEYRWPRGISLVARRSCCPRCGTSIKPWHNVPVLGWLWLGGHCAACQAAIPARYAYTELLFGGVFAALMLVEFASGGTNLPHPTQPSHPGMAFTVWTMKPEFMLPYIYHQALLTYLLLASIFSCDYLRVPMRITAVAVLLAVILPLLWHPLAAVAWSESWHAPVVELAARKPNHVSIILVVLNLVLGGVAGCALGSLMIRRADGNVRSGDGTTTLTALLLVGICLGWQATVSIAFMAIALRWLLILTPARAWPNVVWITTATVIQLTVWRWLYASPLWPGSPQANVVTAITLFALPAIVWILDHREQGGDAAKPVLSPAFPVQSRQNNELAKYLALVDAAGDESILPSDASPTAFSPTNDGGN